MPKWHKSGIYFLFDLATLYGPRFSGINLVKTRSEAMQHCSELAPSGMMTIFFGANHQISLAIQSSIKWVEEKYGLTDADGDPVKPVCVVASHLYSGTKVLAGHEKVK